MPNRSNYSTIVKRLINDNDLELMPHELSRMLEEELGKPEEEIDVALVDELLKLLEEAEPSEVEKRRIWHGISNELGRNARKTSLRAIWRRVAVVVIGVITLFTLTLGTAKALRWTFLLKLLEPLAQTFGITTTDQLTESDSLNEEISIEDNDDEQIVYNSLDTMPKEVRGHTIIPEWIPERYAFAQGIAFRNQWVEKSTVTYAYNGEWMYISVTVFLDENATVDFQYERAIDEPESIDVNGTEVLFYENSREGSIYAAWVTDNVNYSLFGKVTREELAHIIGSLAELT